ncbi:MAG: phosphate ABC transporter permease subunit PstC [Dehalococcoidia bacterium]|nr:phosphate ABC transporter permease subunit PstC [Dehalococcoidia bacterium]MCB9487035.1 phosphate ABC transporter permease subunit PstC [Thermoflexaceae bacterium]
MTTRDLSRPRRPSSLQNRLQLGDWTFRTLTGLAGLVAMAVIVGAFYELGSQAWPAIKHGGISVLWDTSWNPGRQEFGVGVFVIGTLITSMFALVAATIIAVLVSLFLVEVAPGYISRPVSYLIELLAAIPSVVYGLWGIFVMGVFVRDHFGPVVVSTFGWIPIFDGTPLITGLFSACVILTVMILPTVMAVSRDVIAAVPRSQREGLMALGATRWEMIRLTVLPYARSGVMGAAILGLARAVGETLAVTLVIGNSVRIPDNIFSPAYTMASVIANQFPEATGLHQSALIEVALILLAITFIINIVARLLVWKVTGGHRAVVQE